MSNGGKATLRDVWYEGAAPRGFVNVHDQATFTMQASRVATPADKASPAFAISNLDGSVSILTTHIDDRIGISGTGAKASLLGLGTLREYHESNYLENTTAPAATVLMANARQRIKVQGRFSPGTVPIRDTGTVDAASLRRMLADARANILPAPLTVLEPGVSDVRLFRVSASNGLNNISIRP